MTGLSLLPTILTDMVGSVLVILLAFASLRYGYLLTRRKPDNFLYGFLYYFCMALAFFAISRAVGHLVKQVLLIMDDRETWQVLAPFSGGFNTMLMISVSAVIIYYHKGVEAFRAIENKTVKLKNVNQRLSVAAGEMKKMNLHLEEMVEERTLDLTKSEQKFRHFFKNSKDMVYFCDSQNVVVEINRAGLEMLGYEATDAPTLGMIDFFKQPEDLSRYIKTMLAQGYIKDFEVELKRRDDSVIYGILSATALYDENGQFIGCEGIAKDLTRVKTMMEQLISSEKMASVGQMAAGVAHEINTPLGIILGYSQLMMDDFPEEGEVHDNLKVIERQTKACRIIVADLLKFSRQSESARENTSINEVLGDVAAVTEHNLNLDHIQIHLEFDPMLPLIVGDAEKLRQVFVNFVNNAHHAMEGQGGGDLFLRTSHDAKRGAVLATVRDTGHGIPESVRAKIFDPFFTTKSVGKGTGLGLSVSYGIVQDHGGDIEVESPVTSDGWPVGGAAFTVRLPAHAQEIEPVKI